MAASRFGALLSGAAGWSLAQSTFSNPQYIGPLVPNSALSDSTGFDIAPAAGVLIYFSGTYAGQTILHEQTLDPLGVTGWFSVYGQIVSGAPTTPSASFSTSGQCYQFPAAGVRHRITVTAISSGTIVVFASLVDVLLSLNASGGGGGGSSGGTATAANPSYSEGATSQPLSLTLFGAQRVEILDSSGVPVDYTAAATVKGTIAVDAAATDAPVYGAGRAAAVNPTAVSASGDIVPFMLDLKGRQVTMPHQLRELVNDTAITITASTTAADLIAATASTFNDIISITLCNTGSSGTAVQILNADGTTVRWTGYCPPTDMRGITFPVLLKNAASNAKWMAKTVTSTSSMIISVQYVANT